MVLTGYLPLPLVRGNSLVGRLMCTLKGLFAPVQTAATIERLLREAAINDKPALMTDWAMEGAFA